MRTDARVAYTKKIIIDSFIQLLHKKPINKITVKKICEISQINRSTFYKYYNDPYDLMQQIEDETIHTIQELIEELNNKTIENILTTVLSLILDQKVFYQCLFYKHDIHNFNEKLLILCYQFVPAEILQKKHFSSLKEQEWFYYFLAQGGTSILDCWIRDGMQDKPQAVAQFIGKMYHDILKS